MDHILDELKSAANGCGIHKALKLLGDEPLVWCGSPRHPPLIPFLFWFVSSNRADCLMFLGFLVLYLLEKDYQPIISLNFQASSLPNNRSLLWNFSTWDDRNCTQHISCTCLAQFWNFYHSPHSSCAHLTQVIRRPSDSWKSNLISPLTNVLLEGTIKLWNKMNCQKTRSISTLQKK